MRELAFEREQLLVAEESARAEPGAVDEDGFVQAHQILRGIKLANDNAASKEEDVTNESVQVD